MKTTNESAFIGCVTLIVAVAMITLPAFGLIAVMSWFHAPITLTLWQAWVTCWLVNTLFGTNVASNISKAFADTEEKK